ncbi:glycosyltransferase [Zavarzinia sp. CC-PAN008]|uniref:glycosyltransferase n=1 Tax=Zavarzinia sp. CC-PAN008 TaxID=3243332 RepID=UPI003F74790C
MFGLAIYALVLTVLVLATPTDLWDPASHQFIFLIGAVAAWRYSWGALHLVRSLVYRLVVFPRWRRRAAALPDGGRPPHVYLLLTSFRIDTDTTWRVYRAAIEEAIAYGAPATIVASIVEMSDQRLIKAIFARANPPPHVELAFVRIAGTGKRDALAFGFRAISALRPADNAVVCVIDGDTILEPGLLEKCLPLFDLFPKAGALTTDEVCDVEGARIFREWYAMRFAQRQILMSSLGLSRRVLTLTGRMSAFRAHLVTDPEFIRTVEVDYVDHWRLGRFKFLTGDDKSSWFHLLRDGWEMLYVPDARIRTVEHPPDPRFVPAATMLMVRWFGNMLRTNARAIRLGPGRMGLFVWWCILDQRLSMWTSLVGPVAVAALTITHDAMTLPIYFLWIAISRYLQTLMLLTARRDVSWYYPFLLYFNQIWGSAIKTYILFRLDRQKWTRQKTTTERGLSARKAQAVALGSAGMHVLTCTSFVLLVFALVGALPPLDLHLLTSLVPQ